MQIECPNCAARYEVPTGSIGERGRKVRCAKCGTSWHQTPQADTPMPTPAMAPAPAPAPAPPPRPRPAPPPPEPQPEPPRQSVSDALDSLGPADDGQDGDDFDLDRPNALSDIDQDAPARRGKGMRAGRMGARARGGQGRASPPVIAIVLLTVVGLGAVAVVARDAIARAVPPLASVYEAVGLSVDTGPMLPPGDPNGLFTIRDLQTEVLPAPEGGQVLFVRGSVVNSSDEPWRVPPLQVSLIDGEGGVVDVSVVEAARITLAPDEATGFEAAFDNPDPSTSRVEVVVVPPDAMP